jgi:ComEC/Rec2-related protein
MIGKFISFFVIGALLARQGFGPSAVNLDFLIGAIFFLGISALFVGLKTSFSASLIICVLGLVWGISHAGRTHDRERRFGRIVQISAVSKQPGPILVEANGLIFESFGPQHLGSTGELSARVVQNVFASSRLIFRVIAVTSSQNPSWWERLQSILQHQVERMLEPLDFLDRRLIGGIVFGTQESLPSYVRNSFMRTGLYHVLVVSGLHVTLIAALLAFTLKAPLQFSYAFRIISPTAWRQVSAALQVGSALCAMAYLSLSGASAAAQRSALFFVIRQLSSVFCGDLPLKNQLLYTALAQILIFPLGFLSEGTLMSWAAYLIVVRRTLATHGWSISALLGHTLWIQFEMTVLVAAVFGQLIILGLLANLIFVSVFPVIIIAAMIALLRPPKIYLNLALEFPRNYVYLVSQFDRLCDLWPLLSLSREELPASLRAMAVVVSVIFVLNAFRRLSISTKGGVHDGRQTLERMQSTHH